MPGDSDNNYISEQAQPTIRQVIIRQRTEKGPDMITSNRFQPPEDIEDMPVEEENTQVMKAKILIHSVISCRTGETYRSVMSNFLFQLL